MIIAPIYWKDVSRLEVREPVQKHGRCRSVAVQGKEMRVSLRLAGIFDALRIFCDFSNDHAALDSSSLTSLSNSDLSSLC